MVLLSLQQCPFAVAGVACVLWLDIVLGLPHWPMALLGLSDLMVVLFGFLALFALGSFGPVVICSSLFGYGLCLGESMEPLSPHRKLWRQIG